MEQWEGAQLNAAKIILADHATEALHGKECLDNIHATVASLFVDKGASNLDSLEKYAITNAMNLDLGVTVVDILVLSGMVSSKGEGKRLIKAGGARVNDIKISDEAALVFRKDFDEKGRLKLSSGKKKNVLITTE